MKNCFFACLLFMATSTANAMLVNIDFGPSTSTTYAGQGILGTGLDTTWNSVGVGTAGSAESTNLDYADGSGPSGVAVTVDGLWDFEGANLTNPTVSGTNPLLGDRIAYLTPNALATITLTGLTAGQLYDIVLYTGFYAQVYSIIDQPGITATIDPVYPGGASSNYPNWDPGEEYVVLASVVADLSGEVGILVAPFNGINDFPGHPDSGADLNSYAEIAGVQIQSVPLPAAVYLFGAGLLGLAGIARRKKTA